MRHRDTVSLREMMKGYTALDTEDTLSDQQEQVAMPPMAVVRGGKTLPLPEWEVSHFSTLLEGRRSRRAYDGSPLTLEELAFLLWAAQGVRAFRKDTATLRTAPSAGARHPLELYAFVNGVEDLEPGLYHYLALENRLELINQTPEQGKRLADALAGQVFAGNAPVCLVWTAVPYRSEWRYDNKAQKYTLLDAGHSCQNVYLACESLGLGCCAIAAYEQEKLDALLGLPSGPSEDKTAEFAIYACCVGRPK